MRRVEGQERGQIVKQMPGFDYGPFNRPTLKTQNHYQSRIETFDTGHAATVRGVPEELG